MRRTLWIGIAATVLAAQAVRAAQAGSDPAVSELMAVEDARFQAQVAHDAAAVARALADELIYTHATGRVQTKQEVVAGVSSGGPPYRAIAAHDRVVRVFGDAGMIRGIRDATVGDRTMTDSYLAVYIRRGGRWQLLAWQTSPGPMAAGTPR